MKTYVKWLGLLLFALAGAPAHAQVSKQMDRIFDSMSNTSSPSVVMTQRRGVISGGSFEMRNPITRLQIASFDPPHISGGCGGIDMYGGSFSFANKAAYQEYAKSVISNASGYAFQLALGALCQDCLQNLQSISEKIEEMNRHMKNSCEAGQWLVNTAVQNNEWLSSRAQAGTGDNKDLYAALHMGPGQESPASSLSSSNPELAQELLTGNVIWKALKKSGSTSWFIDGGDATLEDVMSFTGTVIVCAEGTPHCSGARSSDRPGSPIQRTVVPNLGLKDLVYGGIDSGRSPVFWKCVDNDQCLEMTQDTNRAQHFKGFLTRVRDVVLGPDGDSSGGLIGKYRHHIGSPTQSEQGLMAVSGPYTAIMLRLADQDESDARMFAVDFMPELASEVVTALVEEQLRVVAAAISNNPQFRSDAIQPAVELIAKARSRLYEERDDMHKNTMAHAQMLAYYNHLASQMPPVRVPEHPGGTSVSSAR